ncbi:MAG: GreA/GreB family elongation factor [Elusimicrobiota bacterium]
MEAAEENIVAELAGYSGAQPDPARRRRKRELERDLRYVRARLETAIPVATTPKEDIRFGARVILRREDGAERIIRIVGEDEAEEGGDLVPWSGPFVQALFGLKTGGVLEWDGERWTVVSVEYAA